MMAQFQSTLARILDLGGPVSVIQDKYKISVLLINGRLYQSMFILGNKK